MAILWYAWSQPYVVPVQEPSLWEITKLGADERLRRWDEGTVKELVEEFELPTSYSSYRTHGTLLKDVVLCSFLAFEPLDGVDHFLPIRLDKIFVESSSATVAPLDIVDLEYCRTNILALAAPDREDQIVFRGLPCRYCAEAIQATQH